MSDWQAEVSDEARRVMDELGCFAPTVNVRLREVKGYVDGSKCYYNSDELREIAAACVEVAKWLDKRANEAQP